MRVLRLLVTLLMLVGLARFGSSGELEDQLGSRLRGAWAVLRIEVTSGCAGAYFNNRVTEAGVTANDGRRFVAGEVVKVDKINLKRERLDLFCTLAEPVLVGRMDGPFELFDERSCKAQLMVEIPRAMTKAKDVDAILGRVRDLMEQHGSRAEAESSALWNRRRRRDYPPDYDLTLARHAAWQAEQLNAAIADRIDTALEEAERITGRIRRDKAYLDGFAAGTEEMRSWHERDCDDLLEARFDRVAKDPPSDQTDKVWRDGFDDGQALVFNQILAKRLGHCYVPVPQVPQP